MSHECESLFYVESEGTPWHGLGTPVNEPLTSKEAIIAAGLNWEVEKRPLFASDKVKNGSPLLPIETHEAVVRATDSSILGIVGNSYVPVQNEDAFQFMDALVAEGKMKYHVAGSLRNGQRIWLLGKIGEADIVPGDTVMKYMFLYNSHDGSGALRALETAIRVVCANTARAALSAGKNEGFYFRHTTNIKRRVEQAREALGIAMKEFDNYVDFAKETTKLKFKAKDIQSFAEAVVPDNPELESNARAENKRDDIINLFEAGRGQDIKGVKGTGWAAYSAVVEYVNYMKSTRGDEAIRQERRFESALFGSGQALVERAVADLSARAKAA